MEDGGDVQFLHSCFARSRALSAVVSIVVARRRRYRRYRHRCTRALISNYEVKIDNAHGRFIIHARGLSRLNVALDSDL